MTTDSSGGRNWADWLASPAGRYLLQWQQQQYDSQVADVFGYFALQCGLPLLDCLRANRMPNRILARSRAENGADGQVDAGWGRAAVDGTDAHPAVAQVRIAHFEELPFDTQSLDLVVLPQVLEFAQDPHQVLREVERVLRPEGRVIVSGLNPVSLWGVHQVTLSRLGMGFLPREGRFIGLPRLRDWLKLLGFELDSGRYGCYRPPCRTQRWLDRTAFMEKAGDRWWPICGASYFVGAVKHVRGMRLVGPAWTKRARAVAPVAAASQRRAVAPVHAARGGSQEFSDRCNREKAAVD
ncbi:MAG: methyltransferase domain-containing protein [Burkholderiaceae bacterium]|nr:methyltransferase domain-containing protein [Burkholderiaceae bacterium]